MYRLLLLLILLTTGCTSARLRRQVAHSPVFSEAFTGFALYDPARKRTLSAYQQHKHFLPASNVKILTLYVALRTLPDTLPALRYRREGDALVFTGTGSPTLLHPDRALIDSTAPPGAFRFLHDAPGTLYYAPRPTTTPPFGSGWAWDDYNDAYAPERGTLPLYGQVVGFDWRQGRDEPHVVPAFFEGYLVAQPDGDGRVRRGLTDNTFRYRPVARADGRQQVPFRTSDALTRALLADTLKRAVLPYHGRYGTFEGVVPGLPADRVYRRMMHVSDNLLAEQLLMMCTDATGDTIGVERGLARGEALLRELPDAFRWVDGSGLSRYNLQTPANLVAVLGLIAGRLPEARLYDIFPAGGQTGTVRGWYAGADAPYVYAKSGTLGNQHCLSGYVLTKRGRRLIFSFMHNNFMGATADYKAEMERLLRWVREHY